MSTNLVVLLGRLGADPEVRATQSGKKVANLRLATSLFSGSGDTRTEKTEWHRVILFDKLADVVEKYTKKGDQLQLTGRLQTRKYQAQDGSDRYQTEIIANTVDLIGSKDSGSSNESSSQHETSGVSHQASGASVNDLDDDIPF
ncbi:MAG: single-stranded DNA-binding protein [Acidiphilium sp.]|nr:single-stranded DNA-binding protein [Acidiphilium sp.]